MFAIIRLVSASPFLSIPPKDVRWAHLIEGDLLILSSFLSGTPPSAFRLPSPLMQPRE